MASDIVNKVANLLGELLEDEPGWSRVVIAERVLDELEAEGFRLSGNVSLPVPFEAVEMVYKYRRSLNFTTDEGQKANQAWIDAIEYIYGLNEKEEQK